MDAQLHPGAPRRLQDRAALLRREDAGLAEHVAPLGEPLARDGGDHLVDDEVDVVAAAIAVLDRHLVRAHEGRRDLDRMRRGELPHDAQHLQLALDVERVAALRLARGRAASQHLVEPAPGRDGELLVRRRARRADAADDAAAAGRDLRVGRARKAAPQLVAAIAGEDNVRVRVDQSRHDRAGARVDDDRVGRERAGSPPLHLVADEHDCSTARGDDGARPRTRVALRAPAPRRRPRAREHFRRVVNEEVGDQGGQL